MPAIRDWIKDIKRFWSGDKESKITDLARGSSALIGGGKDASSLSMQSLSMQNGAYEELHKTLFLDPDIMNRYTDYEEMDDYPELSAALDVYADDCTIPDNVHNKTIWAICDDAVVRNVVDDLLSRRLRIEDDIYGLVRTLCKYGNAFAEVVANETGVLGLNYLSPPTVRRIEDGNGTLLCYVQSMSRDISLTFDELKKELAKPKDARKGVNGCTIFDPWEIVHWRLRTKNMRSAYGCSVLDSARWIWRRLMMMEDTALVYKLTRSPARYAFYVDTGDLPPDEAIAYVRQVQRQYKNKKLVNPTTGQLDFRYNPLSPHEDFWIPTRGGKDSTRIEVISGPDYQCLTGDTPIPLLDGTTQSIAQLCENNGDFWVYSLNERGEIVPGRGHSARKTKKAKVWEVELDNGEVVRCSDNHPFMMRDGSWLRADQLFSGDSLMPMYSKMSSKGDGDRLSGYEKVFDPATGEYVYTHQAVNRAKTGSLLPAHGSVIHHSGDGKLDNRPDSLIEMTRSEHARLHVELSKHLHSDEVKMSARRARCTPGVVKKLRAAWTFKRRASLAKRNANASISVRKRAGERLTKWNKSKAHQAQMTADNPNKRFVSMGELIAVSNRNSVKSIKEMYALGYSQNLIYRVLREAGMSWSEFAAKHIDGWQPKGRAVAALNHKVVSVTCTEKEEWLYDLTVDEHHNFAVGQGVFVHNSMEDVEYFRSKMVAIIKVPRRYLGLEEGANRSLSQEDVRFARTCMRIQREFKNGIRRVIRIHLAAMNIDPDVTEYSTEMSIPSYIFELAQIEVRNAQAGLAQMLEMYFPKEWIIRHIFGFSDGDAAVVKKEKSQEMRRDAIDNASVQSEIIRDYPEVTGMPPVMPEQDMQGQETAGKGVKPGSNFGESIDRRVERLVKQSLDSSIASRDAVKEIREGIIPLVRDMHRRKMTG